MFRFKYSNLCLIISATLFFIISKFIFDRIYITSQVIVDEEFHLPLGKAYCNFEYDQWHPKVTTLPGLYILSSIIFGPWGLCSIYWLRFTSLIFATINVFLFYVLLNQNNNDPTWKNIISSLNLALLPPLYFFSHLYYTDVSSLTMILLLLIYAQRGNHYLASIFGLIAVIFRQTNIIWVGMVAASYILKEINAIHHQKKIKRHHLKEVTFKEFIELLKSLNSNSILILKKASLDFWLNLASYATLLIFFVLFIIKNGGIVVGDKTAHEATIHIPQIFYFAIFTLFFAWPFFLVEVLNFYRFIMKFKLLSAIFIILSLLIIHFNTQVHPYMLADNRHYVFYVWNRFYGKHNLFKYLIAPLYYFAIYSIVKKLTSKRDVTFLLFFIPSTIIVLTTQRLLEFRYFFIPYVLFRTRLNNVPAHSLIYEFLAFTVLNICSLYLFFTKNIYWHNYAYPQKLIW